MLLQWCMNEDQYGHYAGPEWTSGRHSEHMAMLKCVLGGDNGIARIVGVLRKDAGSLDTPIDAYKSEIRKCE